MDIEKARRIAEVIAKDANLPDKHGHIDLESICIDFAMMVVKACGISPVSVTEGKLCDICEENKACTITRACRSCDEYITNGEHY